MTWTGIISALMFGIFAIVVLYETWTNRKKYLPLTRVFFLAYAAFLIFRGYSMMYEPVTVATSIKAIISVATLIPLIIVTVRIMRLGDPFRLTSIVKQLREDLKEKTELISYARKANVETWEKIEIKRKLQNIDRAMRNHSESLAKLLNQRRTTTIVDGLLKAIQVGLSFLLRR